MVGTLVLIITIPRDFPHHMSPEPRNNDTEPVRKASFSRLDYVGATSLLAATVFLVTALEQAGLSYRWKSLLVITLLALSGLLWVAFLIWERKATLAEGIQEPVFPWRCLQSRIWIGMLL